MFAIPTEVVVYTTVKTFQPPTPPTSLVVGRCKALPCYRDSKLIMAIKTHRGERQGKSFGRFNGFNSFDVSLRKL